MENKLQEKMVIAYLLMLLAEGAERAEASKEEE